jgi:3',5'-cyclic AMP phosphodiesterase CpdA
MRIVQISDTHLFDAGGVTAENAGRVVDFVNETLRPDLVVHTGDVVGLSPDHDGDRRAAVAVHAQLRAPLLVVPGNHDVGDPGDTPWMGLGVTSARVAEHRRVFGEIPFLESFGDWGVLGLNSQVVGSGLAEEQEQWEWLERTLAAPGPRKLLLFMHMPLWAPLGFGEATVAVSLADVDRERLLSLPGSHRLRGVGNGHLHTYRRRQRHELLEVWAPSIAFHGAMDGELSPFGQCGVVEWRLDGDKLDAWFRAPATLDERDFMEIPEVVTRLRELDPSIRVEADLKP